MGFIEFKKWKDLAKNLNDSYTDLDNLISHCEEIFGENFTIELSPPGIASVAPHKIEVVYEEDIHPSRDYVYYIATAEKYNNLKKLDTEKMIDLLSEQLKKYVNPKELIADALHELSISELKDIFDRAIVKEGKVKAEEGCFQLKIYGKRGSPAILNLR